MNLKLGTIQNSLWIENSEFEPQFIQNYGGPASLRKPKKIRKQRNQLHQFDNACQHNKNAANIENNQIQKRTEDDINGSYRCADGVN